MGSPGFQPTGGGGIANWRDTEPASTGKGSAVETGAAGDLYCKKGWLGVGSTIAGCGSTSASGRGAGAGAAETSFLGPKSGRGVYRRLARIWPSCGAGGRCIRSGWSVVHPGGADIV